MDSEPTKTHVFEERSPEAIAIVRRELRARVRLTVKESGWFNRRFTVQGPAHAVDTAVRDIGKLLHAQWVDDQW